MTRSVSSSLSPAPESPPPSRLRKSPPDSCGTDATPSKAKRAVREDSLGYPIEDVEVVNIGILSYSEAKAIQPIVISEAIGSTTIFMQVVFHELSKVEAAIRHVNRAEGAIWKDCRQTPTVKALTRKAFFPTTLTLKGKRLAHQEEIHRRAMTLYSTYEEWYRISCLQRQRVQMRSVARYARLSEKHTKSLLRALSTLAACDRQILWTTATVRAFLSALNEKDMLAPAEDLPVLLARATDLARQMWSVNHYAMDIANARTQRFAGHAQDLWQSWRTSFDDNDI